MLNITFDGDTSSFDAVISDEATAEVDALFKTRKAYLETDGSFRSSVATDTVDYVLHNMTGE